MIDNADPTPWSERLSALSNAFGTAHKHLRKAPADPFEVVHRINAVRHALTSVGVDADKSLDAVLQALESECVRLEAEFWGLLTQACATRGWDVLGSTNRRLVNKALFVSQDGSAVNVDDVAAGCTPYIPSLMPTLTRVVEELMASEAELKSFLGVLAKVYDAFPRPGSECSLEAVYRQCIVELQKPSFWRNPTSTSFIRLSRPAFRYRISEILRLGVLTTDGRAVTLGTTTMSKDAWEIYSPGEQRVVIAGRLSLTRLGGDNAD
jgi:hypothetical protein